MYKYQNVSDQVQTIVTPGDISPRVVDPGAEVISSVAIENPNFKYVGTTDQSTSASIVGEQLRQENAVIETVTTNGETKKENE